jgi:hypothetical protein
LQPGNILFQASAPKETIALSLGWLSFRARCSRRKRGAGDTGTMNSHTADGLAYPDPNMRWKDWTETSERVIRWLPGAHPLWWYRATSYQANESVRQAAALIPRLISEPIDWIDEDSSEFWRKGMEAHWFVSYMDDWPRTLATLVERARPVNGAVVLPVATATLARLAQRDETPTRRMRLLLVVTSLLRTLRAILEALAWEDWSLLGATAEQQQPPEQVLPSDSDFNPRYEVGKSLQQLLDHLLEPETFSEATGFPRLQSQLFKLAELVVLSFTTSPIDWASRTFSGRDLVALAPIFPAERCQGWVERALTQITETRGGSFVSLLTKAWSLANIARRRADLTMRMLVPLFDVAFRESLHLKRISQKQSAALNLRVLFLGLLRSPHTLPFREELYAALELFGAVEQAENAANFAEELDKELGLEQGSIAPWSRTAPDAPTCRQLEDSEQVVRILGSISMSTPLILVELVMDTFRQLPASLPAQLLQDEESSRMDPRLRAHVLAQQQGKTPLLERVRNELKSRVTEEIKRRRPVIRAQAPVVTAPALSLEQLQTLGQQAVQRLLQAEDNMELCGATELRLALLVRLLTGANYGESVIGEAVVDFIMQDFLSRVELALRWLTALAALEMSTASVGSKEPFGRKRPYLETAQEDGLRAESVKRLRLPGSSPSHTRDMGSSEQSAGTTVDEQEAFTDWRKAQSSKVAASASDRKTDDQTAQAGAQIETGGSELPDAQPATLDETQAKQMTVVQLRAELEKRELDTKGLKKALLERLLNALAAERRNRASLSAPATSAHVEDAQSLAPAHDSSRVAVTESSPSDPAIAAATGSPESTPGETPLLASKKESTMLVSAKETRGAAPASSSAPSPRFSLEQQPANANPSQDRKLFSSTIAREMLATDSRYERLLEVFLQRLASLGSVTEAAFAQFLAQLPRVPAWIYSMLSQMTQEPHRKAFALAAFRELVCCRYSVDRHRALDTMLRLICSDDELVRGPVLRLLADTLFAENTSIAPLITDKVQSWLLETRQRVLDDPREPNCARFERLAAAYIAMVRHDIALLRFFIVDLYAPAAPHPVLTARLQALLADRTLLRWSAANPQLVSLIQEAPIPETSAAINLLVELASDTLVGQRGQLPAPFLEAVWQRFLAERQAHLVLPVLGALSLEQAHQVLPYLVLQLEPDERRRAWERLVLSSGRMTAPFTPSALVEALHLLDTQQQGIPLKRQMDAVQTCFELESTFSAQCWANALQSMIRSTRPLPLMIVRTLLQVLARYPKTHHWILQLLSALVERRVWEYPKLWPGFLRACVMLMPQSATVVIAQLPRSALEQALVESAELRDALTAFAEQHQDGHETAPAVVR